MLLLSAAALAIFTGTAVQARTWNIEVGANGLQFRPNTITAAPADIVVFTFKSGAHTVTQSTFTDPCTPLIGGVDSGPKPVAGAAKAPIFKYTVNSTGPAWFYCKTGHHCPTGMLFAINPTAGMTYDAFKANALNSIISNDTTSSAPSSTASGSTASAATGPAATSKAAANRRATVGIGAFAAALLFGGVSAL